MLIHTLWRMLMQIQIPFEAPIKDLLVHRPEFQKLLHTPTYFNAAQSFDYSDSSRKSVECLSLTVFGQTGYGKSSLLNALIQKPIFKSDAVRATTRSCQSVDFFVRKPSRTQTGLALSFIDLPGIGEAVKADQDTFSLYQHALEFTNIILFVLRADKRDHQQDLALYKQIKKRSQRPILIVLNSIDKIEPLNRKSVHLSQAQHQSLQKKCDVLSDLFSCPQDRIYPISATQEWHLDRLAQGIMQNL